MNRLSASNILTAIVLLSSICTASTSCSIPSDTIVETSKTDRSAKPLVSGSPGKLLTGPIVYVALGDSTGSGVGANEGGYVARLFKRINAQRPGSRLINLCFSGATAADVISEQLDEGIRAAPHLVTLGIGINDIGHGVGLEQFSTNYELILGTIRSRTDAVIVITNIPDISSAPRIPNAIRTEYQQQIVEFNGRLAQIAANHGATVFDIYTYTNQQLPLHPEYFSGDGFHPSDKGYEAWAERMWPTVATTIGVEVEESR